LSKLKNNIFIFFCFASALSAPCKTTGAEQEASRQSSVKLDFLTFLDAYQPLHDCVISFSHDEKDVKKMQEFKNKLWASVDLNAVMVTSRTILGDNHPVFIEMSKAEWSKEERAEHLFQALALFAGLESDPDSEKRFLQVKALALISVQMATITDGQCVPTKKLLNLMEQVPHADK